MGGAFQRDLAKIETNMKPLAIYKYNYLYGIVIDMQEPW